MRKRPRSWSSAPLQTASRAKLSGGQRQRVAMGRAIVRQPRCSCSTSRCPTWTPSCAQTAWKSKAAPRTGHHQPVRHPRPGRGHDPGAAHDRDERRWSSSARPKRSTPPGQHLCGQLHRRAAHEPARHAPGTLPEASSPAFAPSTWTWLMPAGALRVEAVELLGVNACSIAAGSKKAPPGGPAHRAGGRGPRRPGGGRHHPCAPGPAGCTA